MAKRRERATYATVGQMNRIDQLLTMKPPEISIMTGEEKCKCIEPEMRHISKIRWCLI